MPPKKEILLINLSDDDLDKLATMTHKMCDLRINNKVATSEQTENYTKILEDSNKKAGSLHIAIEEKDSIKFSFIDLFAGIGGFRLAGEICGGECSFSCEKDKYARISYYHNFGEFPYGDIYKITKKNQISNIPDHDVLCGGFPCQAFSVSGKRLGFADSRGILFYEIIKILKNKIKRNKPAKIVFLENVKNLEKHGPVKGETLKAIKNKFSKIGYTLLTIVLNSGLHGAATKRERIYLIAIHNKSFSQDALEAENQIKKFEHALINLKKREPEGQSVKQILENLMPLNDEEIKKYKIPENRIITKLKTLNELNKEAELKQPSLRPLQIGKIGKIGDSRNGRQGERIYSIYGQATTFSAHGGGLAAKTGAYLIDGIVRKLTPTECAIIMGFKRGKTIMKTDELTKIGVSESQLYKQFGNSVVVPTVQIIFKLIQEHFFP
jgi:DNA (cytosine-5)-methyltransferase 1